MKRSVSLWIVFLMVLSLVPAAEFASALYGTKVIDGNLGDWGTLDLIGQAKDNGLAGANLDKLYVAWDDQYLYIAVKTNNTQSWSIAYGIGIDVDPGSGNGYTGDSSPNDAWGRRIGFGNGYAIDYEIYFWWDWGNGMSANNFITWTGGGWDYKSLADVGANFAYTGDTSTGLQVLEIKIPWSALGGKPNKLALITWAAGGGESSAVSSVPWDATLESLDSPFASWYSGDEWGDSDYFTELAEVQIAPKTIDGDLGDWASYELVGVSTLKGPDGADLDKLYVSYDDQYLYLALTTNNTANWGIVYGFGIDVKDGGYSGDTDAWGRKIGFIGRGVDYEIYFWMDTGNAKIGGGNFITWNGQGWDFQDVGTVVTYDAQVDPNLGLQVLEMAIPWEAIGGRVSQVAIIAWVAGGFGGDSAVDTVPLDPEVDGSDWTDQDYLSSFAIIDIPIPKPELTVSLSSNVLDVEQWQPANITIKVKNIGEVDAQNVTVHLYDGNDLLKSWVVNLSAHAEVNLTYLYSYSEAWGVHTLRAVVDPNNEIDEANEDNNVATLDIIVGQIAERQNRLVRFGMYVWPRLYPAKYEETKEMVENLLSMGLPSKYEDIIKGFELRLNESLELFNEGKSLIYEPHYELRGAMKMFSAYSRLLRLQREIKDFLESLGFKKKIDGSLSDWDETSLVAQNKAGAGAGAYLDALYVDYDDEYIYIALSTKNTESWRIAYGFAFDYKDGGYTGDTDAWGRKIGFARGVDAEIYLYWNGPFFGEPGTNTITSAEFAIWSGTGWNYLPLFKNASVKYTGGEKGLQTLEIAIPWELFGEKPEKIYIVAWITGANAGDSAVTTIPDDPSVHDSDNEWGDADVISTFAEVYIE
ncbi:CARDB (Cell adhesion related domain found in bacteria) domain-containing protein [Thermococcus sp. 2319x1]|uniref:CARDB domain-containing protein n=1 Tax=Thermococcus sp. 2319x1 TaxID=1674923 RepID=UPI00073ADD30|nr:CARDB domain-containing protein [Thermococcus sp. 2319x1]ALV62085.1 CARDB (Cell adhesion related domain found in bacteria) domain-containing protein [Thermococcus sp. 2319x1]